MGQINVDGAPGRRRTHPWDRGELNPEPHDRVLDQNQIGSILSGGGAWPPVENDDGRAWAEMTNTIQQFAIEHSRLRIPIVYGVDAVHGHNNIVGATMFPHQIGLGATFDPKLAADVGDGDRSGRPRDRHDVELRPRRSTPRATCAGAATTSPSARTRCWPASWARPSSRRCRATTSSRDHGRRDGQALRGLLGDRTAATTATDATSRCAAAGHHLPPFKQGVDAGARHADGQQRRGQRHPGARVAYLLTDVLRDKCGFDGVVVCDWDDVETCTPSTRSRTTIGERSRRRSTRASTWR